MPGLVPFAFRDRQAASKALTRLTTNKVFEVTTPAFDVKARAEFNGCPVKPELLLSTPTTIKVVPPTSKSMLEHPATSLEVSMGISKLLQLLKASDSAKALSQTSDVSGKFLRRSSEDRCQRKRNAKIVSEHPPALTRQVGRVHRGVYCRSKRWHVLLDIVKGPRKELLAWGRRTTPIAWSKLRVWEEDSLLRGLRNIIHWTA